MLLPPRGRLLLTGSDGWGPRCRSGFHNRARGSGAGRRSCLDLGYSTCPRIAPTHPQHQPVAPRITNHFYSSPPSCKQEAAPHTHTPRGLFPRGLFTCTPPQKTVQIQPQCKERLWQGQGEPWVPWRGEGSTQGTPEALALGCGASGSTFCPQAASTRGQQVPALGRRRRERIKS